MSKVLKRKMFKLGGEVSKSHGVGLTHGLKFNKGGKVAPIGSDVYPKVMGPDGQMREGHIYGMLPAGARALFGAAKAAYKGGGKKGIESLKNFINKPSLKGGIKGDGFIMGGKSVAPGALTKAFRTAQLASPLGLGAAGVGAGMAGLDRAGITKEGNDDSLLETLVRETGRYGLNLSAPGLLFGAQGLLRSSENDSKEKSLYKALSGKKDVEEIKSDAEDNAKKEEKDMSNMQTEAQARMAEYYQLLGGGQTNKMMQASKALLAAAPLVSDGDYARAMSAAGGELIGAQEQDQKIAQEAALMTIQEMRQEETAKQETINQIMLNNGIDSAVEAERVYEAMEKTGSVSAIKQLPLKTNGKQDTELTQPGVVYTDVTNISGSLFVVYNSAEEPLRTNDYQAALAHAEE